MGFIFKILGIIGVLMICAAVLSKNRKRQNKFFLIAGFCLEIYSIYLQDWVFIVLQWIFITSALYDLARLQALEKK